jgi:hypothetical protein
MNRSIFILATLLSIISTLLGACNSGPLPFASSETSPTPTMPSKTYTNYGHNFSTDYPADWDLSENQTLGSQGILAIFMGPLSTQDSSIVIEADKWPTDSTLKQYAAAVESQILKKNLQDYVKLKEDSATISGLPAILRTFTGTFKSFPRKYAQIYFVKADFAYTISYSNNKDSFDTFYNGFELVISTFKFK